MGKLTKYLQHRHWGNSIVRRWLRTGRPYRTRQSSHRESSLRHNHCVVFSRSAKKSCTKIYSYWNIMWQGFMVDSEQDFLWPHACMHHTFTRILVRIYNWKTIVFSQIFLSHLFCLLQLVGYFVCGNNFHKPETMGESSMVLRPSERIGKATLLVGLLYPGHFETIIKMHSQKVPSEFHGSCFCWWLVP